MYLTEFHSDYDTIFNLSLAFVMNGEPRRILVSHPLEQKPDSGGMSDPELKAARVCLKARLLDMLTETQARGYHLEMKATKEFDRGFV